MSKYTEKQIKHILNIYNSENYINPKTCDCFEYFYEGGSCSCLMFKYLNKINECNFKKAKYYAKYIIDNNIITKEDIFKILL